MSRKLKALLIALLVIAVPAQGIAAMSAGICRALEHHGGSVATPERVMHHGADAEHSVGVQGQDRAASGVDGDPSGLGGHCGGCGVSATIAGVALLFTPDAPRDTVRVQPPDSLAGFLPDGLDRPPLTFPV